MDKTTKLKPCPFCGAQPEPPYTNNVGTTYARLNHQKGCALGLGETYRQTHWIPAPAFEGWNTRTDPARAALVAALSRALDDFRSLSKESSAKAARAALKAAQEEK